MAASVVLGDDTSSEDPQPSLHISAGGTLNVGQGVTVETGTLDVTGSLVADVTAPTSFVPGGPQPGTLVADGGTLFGTLDVPFGAGLFISGSHLAVDAPGGGAGSIALNGTLTFLSSQTLDAATVTLLGGTIAAGSLTFGPALQLAAGSGSISDAGNTLDNRGSIAVSSLSITADVFKNSGSVDIASGGSLQVTGSLLNQGMIDAASGGGTATLDLEGVLQNSGTILAANGGTLRLTSSSGGGVSGNAIELATAATLDSTGLTVATAPAVDFTDPSASTWRVTPSTTGTYDITSLRIGNIIDLAGLNATNLVPVWQAGTGGGLLTLQNGGTVEASFQIAGNFVQQNFRVAGSGADTLLTVACFAEGTRIATVGGDVAVETLCIGDRVVLASGGSAPVTWLGHRRVACRRHRRPHDVQPVCVRRGAFGPNRPRRNLLLSPDHAVALDGVLIPIRYLVNGATIVQQDVAAITYWHLELPAHGIVFAEGLAAESYLDTGNRSAFVENVSDLQLHPDFARQTWRERGCAELVLAGPRLGAARRNLLARAEALGHEITRDPQLAVLADGRSLPAIVARSTWYVRLPPSARRIRLVSRCWVPLHMRPDEHDARRLGVALARTRLDGRPIRLDDPRLSSGWHTPEIELRWTDGDAGIAVAGASMLSFDLALRGTYWVRNSRMTAHTVARNSEI